MWAVFERRGRKGGAVVARLIALLCIAQTACEPQGGPARPAARTEPVPTVDAATELQQVGSAPLRRLSNQEYLNALQDLFPDQVSELPPLPRDADVGGFENDADSQTPSDVRIARYAAIAELYAAAATRDAAAVARLVACDLSVTAMRAGCAEHFVTRMGTRLFRRPLEAEERERFMQLFQRVERAVDFDAAVQLTLTAMLQAPAFLYRPELFTTDAAPGEPLALSSYAMATRLSFLLWESVPDQTLLDAAERDQLRLPEQLRAQAERMLSDARAKRVFWDFHRQWLGLDRLLDDEHSVRAPAVDTRWSLTRRDALLAETRRFVENVSTQGGTLADLLQRRSAWVDRESADLYGLPALAAGEDIRQVELPPTERAGVLTRAAFLAAYSHRGATSPPVRANAIQLRMLCRLPMPPPAAADTTPPTASPTDGPLTNRALFEERTRPAACMGCHKGLNGLGFGFEHYTASGAFTATDQGLPVDARGSLLDSRGISQFDGAVQLSKLLSESRELHRCALSSWLRFAMGRANDPRESALVESLTERSLQGASLRELLLQIVVSPTFRLGRGEGS